MDATTIHRIMQGALLVLGFWHLWHSELEQWDRKTYGIALFILASV